MRLAILGLIDSADLTKWDDNEDELPTDKFFGDILRAVAERYNAHQLEPHETRTPYQILIELIGRLEREGKL